MPGALKLTGFEDLKEMLRALPPNLASEGGAIVMAHAFAAAEEMRARYPEGSSLATGLRVEGNTDAHGTIVRIRQRARLAYIWEYGTVQRETMKHAKRGKQNESAGPGFVAIAVRHRRIIREAIGRLMVQAGLTVRET